MAALEDPPELRQLRGGALAALAATTGGSSTLRGAATGLLYADGIFAEADVIQHLRGHLLSGDGDGAAGPQFLAGLLRTARSVLWTVGGILDSLNETLRSWDEDRFVKLLPSLRLGLADLTPRETNLVAGRVATLLGSERLDLRPMPDVSAHEVLRAVEVNRLVRQVLAAVGLEAYCE